ncbi:hypothetical protein D3C71_1155760 [compost metagenome]
MAADAGQRFFHAFELADGHAELAAHARIPAHGARRQLGHAGVGRGQRNRTARGQAFHQHAPALAGHGGAADDEVQRHEDVGATRGAIHEHGVQGEVAAAGVHAGMVVRHQRASDAQVFLAAQQAVGVVQAERQAQQRADRRQRDVALVPGDAHADHFAALPFALADNAAVGNGGGIRTRPRAGQRKGRHVFAARQARQVVVLLFIGAVMQQQLGGAQRVGHHDRHRQRGRARRQLGHDFGMGIGRERQAAIFLGDDHAQKALGLQIGPDLGRQVVAFLRDAPVIDHAAGGFGLVIQKVLFFVGQARARVGQQAAPVGAAAKQLAFPPHRAGLQRVALGVRHLRQHLAVQVEDGRGQQRPAQRPHGQHDGGKGRDNEKREDHCVHFFCLRKVCLALCLVWCRSCACRGR